MTAGSCPRWFTDNGPKEFVSLAMALMGTSWPVVLERIYNIDIALASR